MYVHPSHRFNDQRDILALIESHPLGAWVCPAPEGLLANHVPFLLDRSRGEHGTLVAHVSRANPVWRVLQHAGPSIVLFRGPQAYITPNWCPTKTTHGQVVPTWDYVAVNVHGTARALDDVNELRDLVERLTQRHESVQPTAWKVSDAPGRYIDKMLRAIVGFEIPIDRIKAKLKASQDEAMDDRLGTVQGLGSVHALSAPAPGVWAEAMRGAGRAVVASTTSGLQRGSAPPRPPARRVAPRRGRCGVVGTRQGNKPCLAPPPCSHPRLGQRGCRQSVNRPSRPPTQTKRSRWPTGFAGRSMRKRLTIRSDHPQRDLRHPIHMHPAALLAPLIALYIPALAIPGQNFLAVTQASLDFSRRHGIVTALGVSSGSTLQAIVAALGVGFLMTHAEPIQRAVALLGGSYLLYMARAIWLQARVPLEGAAAQPRRTRSMLVSYRQGLFTNLTNPKALVFFSTIFAGLLGTQASPSNRMLAVACIGVLSTSWHVGLATVFTRPTVRVAYGRVRPMLSRLTALILGGFGLRLIWSAAAGR